MLFASSKRMSTPEAIARSEHLGLKKPVPHVEHKWDSLQKFNFVLFVVHLILTIVFTIYFRKIFDDSKGPTGINLGLYDHIFKLDPTQNTFDVLSQQTSYIGESTLSSLIVTFFAITASFHLFYALNPRGLYLKAVENGNNYFRWMEYSVTATMMLFIIAVLSGVKDVKNYFMIVTSAIGMIWTGQWFETSTGVSRWLPIATGFILLLGVFITIYTSFNDRISEAREAGVEIPSWLYLTVIIMFVFYASFGFVPVASTIFGGDYRKYEFVYLSLSLASKATLGMLVAYGFGQRVKASQAS